MQRALFSQFSCAFKAFQAKEHVLMQKLTQAKSEAALESPASVSDFDEYLNYLHSTAATEASATVSAKSDLTAFA